MYSDVEWKQLETHDLEMPVKQRLAPLGLHEGVGRKVLLHRVYLAEFEEDHAQVDHHLQVSTQRHGCFNREQLLRFEIFNCLLCQ